MVQEYLESHGFFIHLFLISDLYFVFAIYQVVRTHNATKIRVAENDRVRNYSFVMG